MTRALISEFEITTKEVGLCSVNFSQSSSEVLVSKTTGETLLVDIDLNTIVKTYDGYRDEEKEWFVIRSTFGGANENFVVSGSRGEQNYENLNSSLTRLQMEQFMSGTRKTHSSLRS